MSVYLKDLIEDEYDNFFAIAITNYGFFYVPNGYTWQDVVDIINAHNRKERKIYFKKLTWKYLFSIHNKGYIK